MFLTSEAFLVGSIISAALILIIIVALLKGIILSKHNFKCTHCDQVFNPKFYQVMFESHFVNNYIVKCPKCKRKRVCIDKNGFF